MKGRKRKSGKREPNGRISRRAAEPADARARAAREMHFGISHLDSGTELAGTAIGRMLMRGLVSRRQYDAAREIANRYSSYSSALGLRSATVRSVNLCGVGGSGTGADMDEVETQWHVARWDEVVKAMDEAGRLGQLYALVWDVVICDREARKDVSPLLIRVALESVADVCGLHMDNLGKAA